MSEIDVNNCKYYDNYSHKCYEQKSSCDGYNDCSFYNTCYYKQLQQLKIENEKLRFPRKDIDFAVLTKEEFENYNKLKAENEELKKLNEQLATYYPQEENELLKVKQCFDEIEEIVNNFAGKDIITLPDLSKEKNYKLIAKQYAEPIKQIIQIIKRAKDGE